MLKRKNYLIIIVTLIICIILVGCTQKTYIPTNNEQSTLQIEELEGLEIEEKNELENKYLPYFYDQYIRPFDTDLFVYNTIDFVYNENEEYSNTINMNKLKKIIKESTGSEDNVYTKDNLEEIYTSGVLDKHWGFLVKITDVDINGEKYSIKYDAWYFSEDGSTIEDVETGDFIDIYYDKSGMIVDSVTGEMRERNFDEYLNYIEENVTPDHRSIILKKNSDYEYSKYQIIEETSTDNGRAEREKDLTTEEINELENKYLPYFYEEYQKPYDRDLFIHNTLEFAQKQNEEYSNTINMNKIREILKETTGSEENDYIKDISGNTYTLSGVSNIRWRDMVKITDVDISGGNYNIKFDTWSTTWSEQDSQLNDEDFFTCFMENAAPAHSSIILKKNLDYKYSKYQMVK
jgi:hypothetical protein